MVLVNRLLILSPLFFLFCVVSGDLEQSTIILSTDTNSNTSTIITTTKFDNKDELFSNRITIVIILSVVLALFLLVTVVICVRNCLSSKKREQEKQLVRANTKLNSKISRESAASIYQLGAQGRVSIDQVAEPNPVSNAQMIYTKNSEKAIIQTRNPAPNENDASIEILNEIVTTLDEKKNYSIRFDIAEGTLGEEETENDVSSLENEDIMHL